MSFFCISILMLAVIGSRALAADAVVTVDRNGNVYLNSELLSGDLNNSTKVLGGRDTIYIRADRDARFQGEERVIAAAARAGVRRVFLGQPWHPVEKFPPIFLTSAVQSFGTLPISIGETQLAAQRCTLALTVDFDGSLYRLPSISTPVAPANAVSFDEGLGMLREIISRSPNATFCISANRLAKVDGLEHWIAAAERAGFQNIEILLPTN